MNKQAKLEVIIWSIAFPGFGQFINGHTLKGVIFLLLEFIINCQSYFNQAIQLSFVGQTHEALQTINMQWLMFYPCVYFFSMYDAYKHAEGSYPPYAFLPFGFAAYAVTTGLMLSPRIYVFGAFLGPIWFPMLCVLPGLAIGLLLQQVLSARSR